MNSVKILHAVRSAITATAELLVTLGLSGGIFEFLTFRTGIAGGPGLIGG